MNYKLLSGLQDGQKHVGVLMGGTSGEREVSIKSGKAVSEALDEQGYSVREVDVRRNEAERESDSGSSELSLSGFDPHEIGVAFIALHGSAGEDGTVQEILQHKGVPFTGSGPKASAYGMDKIASKKRFREADVPTLPYHEMEKGEGFNVPCPLLDSLDYGRGMVVKPNSLGSSLGIQMARDKSEIPAALQESWAYDSEVFLEPRCEGPEITVGILEDQALPLVKIEPGESFFNYHSKYEDEDTRYVVQPSLPDQLREKIQEYAIRAFSALECSDFGRVDFILHEDEPYVLEVNTIPGMTPRSLLPMAAEADGISFPELCERILKCAIMRAK